VVMEAASFIFQQAKGGWQGRWPAKRCADKLSPTQAAFCLYGCFSNTPEIVLGLMTDHYPWGSAAMS
jgi:hypothetical protein